MLSVNAEDTHLEISITRIVDILAFTTVLLFFLHVVSIVISTKIGFGFIPWDKQACRLFNMDLESNIPTWLQSAILFSSSLFAFCAGLIYSKSENQLKELWFVISAVLVFCSLDEISMIHNRIRLPRGMEISFGTFTLPPHFFWIIPAAVGVVIFFCLIHKQLMMIDKPTRLRLVFAAIVYFTGAIGVETISAFIWESSGRGKAFSYLLLVGVEETLEFTGAILCLRAILLFLSKRKSGLYVTD